MNKVNKYRFGIPVNTESIVESMEIADEAPRRVDVDAQNRTIRYVMSPETVVMGLGESIRGINKRGWIYESNNTDQPHHEETVRSLYASQNFLLIWSGSDMFGLYLDYPGKAVFDIGYTREEDLTVTLEDMNCDLYVIEGDSLEDIVIRFREMAGHSYIPPKWAFGYGQSRWGYRNESDIRNVVKRYREAGIPLDMVYLDIDYMDHFKDFTVDDQAFPDFENFVKEMADQNIHLIPIIDAGVKIEKGYDVYEEGIKGDYFCKDKDGDPLVAAVWPGYVHFPDFLKAETREWFGDKYKYLVDMGIEGFWNDMNEPAIFYTRNTLQKASEKLIELTGKELDINGYFELTATVGSISNSEEDYRSFYHEIDGRPVRHDKVHNLYGYNMTRSAGEALGRNYPGRRFLLFSRSSYVGMHRYGGVWTGDNSAWWSNLELNIKQMPALNMTGFLFCGADMGGFNHDTTEDLMMRWLEFCIFTPLMRNHSAIGTREQEFYQFEKTEDFKNLVSLRYALLPYIYQSFMTAATENRMYFKPLCFDYTSDRRVAEVEDQLLVGDAVMIAPVYKQNASGRYVYLPEKMKLLRFRSYCDYDEEILEAGDHYVKASLNEVLVFVRPGHRLPVCIPGKSLADTDMEDISYITFD